ncbi:MAG TPA: aminopeptidase P N-terminal domain-containing protein [Planctomycetota bacterium]|nr:aminopeptidase P N-terminal domain-containing protein [Planctomycetota bacterium]
MQRPTASILCSFLLAIPSLHAQTPAALPEPAAALDTQQFQARRQALARSIMSQHTDGAVVVLVRGATRRADMGRFAQEQDFLYMSGVSEPDVALLMVLGPDGTLARDELLVPPFSRFAATWDGKFLAPGEEASKRTGFATVGNVRSLATLLEELLALDAQNKRPTLFTPTKAGAPLGSTPGRAAEAAGGTKSDVLDGRATRESVLVEKLTAAYPGLEVKSLEPFLYRLRPHKSPAEQELLRQSSRIAAEGIAEAMKGTRPGLYEFQLAAVARYVFSLRGAGPDAYAAIVGGGPNGCILHYNACTRRLEDSDLIVMDYAPTLNGYASDVTRTFPASGRFSDAQRKLVQDVYEIQQALLADVKPGAKLSVLSSKCKAMLVERGYISDHGPCHHVGLAVHDPSVDLLEEGMVITVEPGAYLRDQGMGCRIEDTVLVTSTGCENLSGHLPASPDAIEALMKERGVIEVPVGLGEGLGR